MTTLDITMDLPTHDIDNSAIKPFNDMHTLYTTQIIYDIVKKKFPECTILVHYNASQLKPISGRTWWIKQTKITLTKDTPFNIRMVEFILGGMLKVRHNPYLELFLLHKGSSKDIKGCYEEYENAFEKPVPKIIQEELDI